MYKFFNLVFLSFYSASFYKELVRSEKGLGFSFVLCAALISWLHAGVANWSDLQQFQNDQKSFFEQAPTLTVRSGQMTVEGGTPQVFTVMENSRIGPFSIVFDLDTPVNEEGVLLQKMVKERIAVWIGRDHIFYYAGGPNLEKQAASGFQDVVVDREKWLALSKMIGVIFPLVLIVGFAFASVFNYAIAGLIGGLFLGLISPLFGGRPPLSACMRVAAAALVPVSAFFVVLPEGVTARVLVWFGFAVFGLLAARTHGKKAGL